MVNDIMLSRKTVAADDITGTNECPGWMRISSTWLYDYVNRCSIQNGSRLMRDDDNCGLGRDYKKIRCWVIVDGEKKYVARIMDLEKYIGLRPNALQKHRQKKIKQGLMETVSNGFLWGWEK
jgi:hypothetical protein